MLNEGEMGGGMTYLGNQAITVTFLLPFIRNVKIYKSYIFETS